MSLLHPTLDAANMYSEINMTESRPLQWTAQLSVSLPHGAGSLNGDKITLPPSALEQLLSAAPTITISDVAPIHTTSFDPYNPYSLNVERSVRAQSQQTFQQLPHPLTFRLVNPQNGRIVYAGIREFSADESTVGLSAFLQTALGLVARKEEAPDGETVKAQVTIHAAQLSKGTFVKLRPLEAGYDPEDWKSLLEQHLQKNYTTLTKGEILTVPAPRKRAQADTSFRFLIDSFLPDGDAICIIDTDLEVDIEALNEEQARETVQKIVARTQGFADGVHGHNASSPGGELSFFRTRSGQVLPGDYVDYQIPSWDRSQGVAITLIKAEGHDNLDLFVSPHHRLLRNRPRDDEHVLGDFDDRPMKRVRLSPTNIEMQDAEAIWVSVHAPAVTEAHLESAAARLFDIHISPYDPASTEPTVDTTAPEAPLDAGDARCPNCRKPVPKASLLLHENFCPRNNVLCAQGCGAVLSRQNSLTSHWHCPHDTSTGNTASSLSHHNTVHHAPPYICPGDLADGTPCRHTAPSLPSLALHRTTSCPAKPILCRFCHLEVPQDVFTDPAGALSGLTPHELADGARTTDCHVCTRPVRLRDLPAHLAVHAHERLRRPRPRACRNAVCGRTLDGASRAGDTRRGARQGQGPGNAVGLCSVCFGPLYVGALDPDGRALRRRVERRYLQQLLTGCGRTGSCANGYCRAGRGGVAVGTKDGVALVKREVEGLLAGDEALASWPTLLHFCVDEASQRRRELAELMAMEGESESVGELGRKRYSLEWCIAALEAEAGNADEARQWLENYAPTTREEASDGM